MAKTKSEVKKAVKKKAVKAKPTAKEVEAAKLSKTETNLVEKHGDKIVAGSVRRAPKGSKYGNKMLVTINTRGVDGQFDGQTREVATSDVFQIHHTEEVRAEIAKQRAADKRAVVKAERDAAKPTAKESAEKLGL